MKSSKKEIIKEVNLPNHFSAKLSELDMRVVHSVPPGGNWKNIPLDVPSKRISQIRESYAQGKGSRSTYYGRLLAQKPSYTINTYFNRPGNGCHIHYSQDRVLSQREAARLQSFPDDFVFFGGQTSVNTQIGNAVPPLLSYLIAKQIQLAIGDVGYYIDLFSGAGGMGLGFKWAGWEPLLASDIESKYLETYSTNIHDNTFCGSISDEADFEVLCDRIRHLKNSHADKPLWILGGPPCQGFSTAGNIRTMNDPRNSLFIHYKALIEQIKPDGFVFENVAGLLNMEKGKIFESVQREFSNVMPFITGCVLNTEDFAIPQRRKRVILVGSNSSNFEFSPPDKLTDNFDKGNVKCNNDWVTVEDALSDLPELIQGEDGSYKKYLSEPKTLYQKLMRGHVSPEIYFSFFK